MDQQPTKWIKKEETDEVQTELHFTGQVYPSSMNVKEELQDSAIKEVKDDKTYSIIVCPRLEMRKQFLVDPLKTEGRSVWLKQDPELKHADGPEHNSVEDPLEIPWFTDFIKEDPELNITENTIDSEYWWKLWRIV
ncbi:uncharacterized protein LOC126213267 isoform X2 [Schistocerca nitens]|uniref:uncharacterized protein LOC126213267 isoform X2 n=1 Tax=Schistocerca nitens TaxID=7011 RepID=UPI002118D420|nr:uncharacterized protein LOC126213267 isoform X2 [Schistocerca nitens]